MTDDDRMRRIDELLSHVWMVRTFVKHSDEATDDDELKDVVRELYDYALALGGPWKEQNAADYLKQARKKLAKLRAAAATFAEIQSEVSTHTNFQMAVVSLNTAVREIGTILDTAS
jgi:hypothetical protein